MERVDWATLKFLATGSKASMRYIDKGEIYFITIGAGSPFAYCKLTKDSGADHLEFEADFKDACNKPFESRSTVSGKLSMISDSPEGSFNTYITHDFTDKTTWYQESARHAGVSAASVAGLVYTLQHNPIIDVEHGKVTGEALLSEYILKVYIGGALQTSGYTVDYATGVVTLTGVPSGVVTFDYSVPSVSTFTLSYKSGYVVSVGRAEVQFTKDVIFRPMSFAVWIFHPQYQQMVPAETIEYRSIKDIVNISNLGFAVPAFSGIVNDVIIFPFDYQRPINLTEGLQMEMRIKIIDDIPMTGEFATASLYAAEAPV